MHIHLRCRRLIAGLSAVVFLAAPLSPAAEGNADEKAIRAVIATWNEAHKKGADGVADIVATFSDSAYMIAGGRKPYPRVMGKAAFQELYTRALGQSIGLVVNHEVEKIAFVDTLAAQVGTTTRKTKDGQTQSYRMINFFAKENLGWRTVTSLPYPLVALLFDPNASTTMPASKPEAVQAARAAAEEFAGRSNRAMAAPKGEGKLADDDLCDGAFVAAMPGRPFAAVLDKAGLLKARRAFLARKPFDACRETVERVVVAHNVVALVLTRMDLQAGETRVREYFVHALALQADGWKRIAFLPADLLRRAMDEPAEKTVARKAAETFVGLFNTGPTATPVARLDALLADDFVQVGSDGQVYRGKKANVALFTKGVAWIRGEFKEFQSRYEIESIHTSGDTATVYGLIQMRGTSDRIGYFQRTVRETLVLHKTGGTWRLIHEHSSLPKMPPETK